MAAEDLQALTRGRGGNRPVQGTSEASPGDTGAAANDGAGNARARPSYAAAVSSPLAVVCAVAPVRPPLAPSADQKDENLAKDLDSVAPSDATLPRAEATPVSNEGRDDHTDAHSGDHGDDDGVGERSTGASSEGAEDGEQEDSDDDVECLRSCCYGASSECTSHTRCCSTLDHLVCAHTECDTSSESSAIDDCGYDSEASGEEASHSVCAQTSAVSRHAPPGEWAMLCRTLFVVGVPLFARQLGSVLARMALVRIFGRLRSP